MNFIIDILNHLAQTSMTKNLVCPKFKMITCLVEQKSLPKLQTFGLAMPYASKEWW